MYFLGQAGNYRAGDILRHTFAVGFPSDARKLREQLALRYQVPESHVVLYHTGRSALCAAIKSLAPKHSKVVITSLTCYAVVQAVKSAGCVPIFADVTPETLHFNLKTLEQVYRKHPDAKVVVVQNNLGHAVNIAEIEKFCRKNHLKLIEDLAHCAGVSYPDGRECGTVGDAAILSFGKGKSIDTIAGGALILRSTPVKGIIPSRRPRLSSSLRERFYPLFGAEIRGLYHFNLFGRNLGQVFTGILLKLHFIEKSADAELNLETRPCFWQCHRALCIFRHLPKNRPPMRDFRLVSDREKCLKELAAAGYIFSDIWYDTPVSPERYYEKAHFDEKECPVATELAQQIVNIPTWYEKSQLRHAYAIIDKYDISRQIAAKSAKGVK